MNKETLKKANNVLAQLERAEKVLSDMRTALFNYTTLDSYTSKPLISIKHAELVVQECSSISGMDDAHYQLNSELTKILARVIVDYLEKRTDELKKEFENL